MYVQHLVEIFRAVRRVLHPTGTLWLNLGDSYNGSGGAGGDYNKGGIKEGQPKFGGRNVSGLKQKDLMGMPWRVALALQADGWWLRSDIIWAKGVSFCPSYSGTCMPESVTDRPTKSHEYVFLLSKSQHYFWDIDAIREAHQEDSLARALRGRSSSHKWEDGPGGQTICSDDGMSKICHPGGRNVRSVWTLPESLVCLREDLDPETRQRVLAELASRGLL